MNDDPDRVTGDDAGTSDDAGTDDSRRRGIDLVALESVLESQDYPASAEELVAAYGTREIELPDGSQTFADVLGVMPDDDSTL